MFWDRFDECFDGLTLGVRPSAFWQGRLGAFASLRPADIADLTPGQLLEAWESADHRMRSPLG